MATNLAQSHLTAAVLWINGYRLEFYENESKTTSRLTGTYETGRMRFEALEQKFRPPIVEASSSEPKSSS